MRHSYEIIINKGCQSKTPYVYNYSNTKGIEIHARKDNITIKFLMTVKKSYDDFINLKVNVFKDAYRKSFLLHAVLYDQSIKVKSIKISIDGESKMYDKTTSGFPFIYSMISEVPMKLPNQWKSDDLCQYLINTTKSKQMNDLTSISIIAFLCSKGRPYIIDRFSNLWTSMNAYYNWYAGLYNDYLLEKYHYDQATYRMIKKTLQKKDKKTFENLQNEGLPKGIILNGDRNCMDWLIKAVDSSYYKKKQDLPETKIKQGRHRVESLLSSMTEDELERLYVYSLSLINSETSDSNDEFYNISSIVEEMGHSLYSYLVFELPYKCRCDYIHGNRALLLLSFENEYEVRMLKAASYFVERFLQERIPSMINEEDAKSYDRFLERENEIKSGNLKTMNIHKTRVEKLLV